MKACSLVVLCTLGACGEVKGTQVTDAAPTVDAPPAAVDTDADGLPDAEELAGWQIMVRTFGANDFVAQTVVSDPMVADSDSDGRNDAQEKAAGTSPTAPDTDDDGLTDAEEITASTNGANYDTDNNKLADGTERKGLVALYRLDGVVGGKLLDTAGAGRDATAGGNVAGFTLATDRFNRAGRALYHAANGVNTSVNGWATADIGVLNATSWTVSLWIRTAAVTGKAVGQPAHFALQTDIVAAGTARASATVGATRLEGGTNLDYPADTWTNWVVVRDGVSVTLYRDATVALTATSNFATNTCNYFMLWAWSGSCATTPGGGFDVLDGALDDVRVWNRPLSAREVATLRIETANP